MKKKHVKFLKEIVETPSPTGSEVAVADIVRERLMPIADEIHTDTMGSVHATYEGQLHLASAAAAMLGDDAEEEYATPDFDAPFGGAGLAGDDFHDPYFDDDDDEDEDEPVPGAFGGLNPPDGACAGVPPLTLMLAAHMDEIGLMVTYVSDDGFLSIAALGGVDAAILPGMRVDVLAEGGTLRGVVGRKPIHLIDADERKSVTPLDKLVIDLGMTGKAVKRKVKVGDSITVAAGFERFGRNMATSRAFDDKVGVFIACRVMEKLADDPDYAGNFVAAITVQEEIGTRGAMPSAHAVMPDVALAFDVTHATDYPGIDKTKHGSIVCGGGPVIARGPNINPVVFERLVKAAEDEGISYQLEAEPSVTGTDARAIQVTREGIPTGLVSIPLRYMHTPTEVISLDDVSATVRLITRFAADLDEVGDFVPGHAEDYESDLRLESGQYCEDYDFLLDEVVRLTEEVADLQALAGLDVQGSSGWDGVGPYYGTVEEVGVAAVDDVPLSPDQAPFGRQSGVLSAELASIGIDAGVAPPLQEEPEAPTVFGEGVFGEDAFEQGALDEDDFPAAYTDSDGGVPSINLKFEGAFDQAVYGDPAEGQPGAQPAEGDAATQPAVAAGQASDPAVGPLPIVMVNASDLKDDE